MWDRLNWVRSRSCLGSFCFLFNEEGLFILYISSYKQIHSVFSIQSIALDISKST